MIRNINSLPKHIKFLKTKEMPKAENLKLLKLKFRNQCICLKLMPKASKKELTLLKQDLKVIDLRHHTLISTKVKNLSFYLALMFLKINLLMHLPDLINKFQDSLRLSITTDSSDLILEKTLELETDLGIVGKPVKHPKLVIKPLLRESLHLICNPKHELADKLIIHPSDLVNHPFITHEPGSSTRKAIEEYSTKNNIKLNMIDEIYSPRLVADIVSGTNAISIISRHIISDYVKGGRLKSIPIDGGLFRYFFLIYHKEKYISPVLQQVITALETWCDNYNHEILLNISKD